MNTYLEKNMIFPTHEAQWLAGGSKKPTENPQDQIPMTLIDRIDHKSKQALEYFLGKVHLFLKQCMNNLHFMKTMLTVSFD
jgi:hypothetical protein